MKKIEFSLRKFIAYTLPGIFFSIGGVFNEFFIAQMNVKQILASRILSIVIRIATSWIYGETRDMFLSFFKYHEKEGKNFKYWAVNTFCSVYFGGSLYLIILYVSGANHDQVKMALGTVLLVNAFLGYPYGILIDLSKKFFKVNKNNNP